MLFGLLIAAVPTAASVADAGSQTPLGASSPGQTLVILLLAGLMGLFGQGIRAVIGLKSMVDDAAASGTSQETLFSAARLLISLTIGFLTGIAAAFLLDDWTTITDPKTLLGLAAAGYAGTDAIEAFISKYLPKGSPSPPVAAPAAPVSSATPAAANADAASDPDAPSISDVHDQVSSVHAQLAAVLSTSDDNSLPTLSAKIDEVHALLTAAASPAGSIHAGDITAGVTALVVKKMFPLTPLTHISTNLPFVLDGLRWIGLTDRDMVNMALSTIRAETEGFLPISEGRSKYNTVKSPFDLYEPGTKVGAELGNTQTGDGPLFRGRGFVQLTGRANYERIGLEVHSDLVGQPDLANAPAIAGKILAQFLKNNEEPIRSALARNNLKAARKLVNGGSHGLPQFSDAFERGELCLPT